TVDEPAASEGPGSVIGPYKLLQQIGEGGMGTVFLAQQQHPVQRKVALKVIKPGMDSRQVIARFEAERQALAMMDHVNIARVFDAGATESGRPYFVMELVHGVPITKYCDDDRLTPRERLELFVPVCQAIQHAHQTGSTPLTHKRIKEAAYYEILRMIKEEEPPRPSTRLSDSGEALASISAQRHMEPAKLTKLVRGELDWIVMKCLEKDRNRRYETASGIAADVQRYLNDEAVQACPPSASYRFRKFARRNKRALATVSAVAVVLLLAVAVLATSTVLIVREERVTATALQAEKKAKDDLRRDSYFHRIAL